MMKKKVKAKKKTKKKKTKVSIPKPQSLQVVDSLNKIDRKNSALGVISEGIAGRQAVVRKKKTRK